MYSGTIENKAMEGSETPDKGKENVNKLMRAKQDLSFNGKSIFKVSL